MLVGHHGHERVEPATEREVARGLRPRGGGGDGRRRGRRGGRWQRRVARSHAHPRRPRARHPDAALEGPRPRGGPAQRRRHGQQRGRAQRPRRRPGVRAGRAAGQPGHRDRGDVSRRDMALAPRRGERAPGAGALHRAALRRQRAQPHRSPVRDDPPVRRRGGGLGEGARASRRPRRARDQRAHLRRRARGLPQGLPRQGLPRGLRRRPDEGHHGPLRGRLGDGGPRLGGARPRRREGLPLDGRGRGDPARGVPRGDRPEPPGLRHRRRARRPGGPHPRRGLGGVLQLPRRPGDRDHPGLRAGGAHDLRAGRPAPTCATRG